MATDVNTEKLFLAFCLKNEKYIEHLERGFFINPDIDSAGQLSKQFFEKYTKAPTASQLAEFAKSEKVDLPANVIQAIYNVDVSEYDTNWLKDTTEYWLRYRKFSRQLMKTVEYTKTQKITLENVDHVINTAVDILTESNISKFDENVGLNFFDFHNHKQFNENKIHSGFNCINKALGGGYDPKTLNFYVAPPNTGKSMFLCNDAANFIKMGKNVAFISCEMSDRKVIKRIGSNLFNIDIAEYDSFANNEEKIAHAIDKLQYENFAQGMGELYVKEFPTSQATVNDIDQYLKELEQIIHKHIDVVIIDYINIMCNYRNPNTENTYMKIKQLSEDLRALAQRRDCLIISATQTNREGYDSTVMSMSSIAESGGLAHTADNIFGIIQDVDMRANNRYILQMIKVRDGGGKDIRCQLMVDYPHMRLTEIEETTSYHTF